MCKRLGPVRVRRSKYSLLLLFIIMYTECHKCKAMLSNNIPRGRIYSWSRAAYCFEQFLSPSSLAAV